MCYRTNILIHVSAEKLLVLSGSGSRVEMYLICTVLIREIVAVNVVGVQIAVFCST